MIVLLLLWLVGRAEAEVFASIVCAVGTNCESVQLVAVEFDWQATPTPCTTSGTVCEYERGTPICEHRTDIPVECWETGRQPEHGDRNEE